MAPDRTQRPVPVLSSEVVPVALLGMTPEMVFVPVFVPPRVRVLSPSPVVVKLLVNVSAPLPLAVIVAPPVVPARSTTRSVEAAAPV